MNIFISLLDTTLHMKKGEEKSDDDQQDAVDNKPLFVKKPQPDPILVPVRESITEIEDLEEEEDDDRDVYIPPRRARQQIIETIGGKDNVTFYLGCSDFCMRSMLFYLSTFYM